MFLNVLFILSALLMLGSLVGVLFVRNIMHACIYLLGTLLGVAGLYVTLGADFVAAIQLVVYVGGIVILMLFAVMLTGGSDFKSVARFGIENVPAMGTKRTYMMGLGAALVVLLSVCQIFSRAEQTIPTDTLSPMTSTVERIGVLLVTDYVVAFELSSVLLLGALIGAAIIARPKKEGMGGEA